MDSWKSLWIFWHFCWLVLEDVGTSVDLIWCGNSCWYRLSMSTIGTDGLSLTWFDSRAMKEIVSFLSNIWICFYRTRRYRSYWSTLSWWSWMLLPEIKLQVADVCSWFDPRGRNIFCPLYSDARRIILYHPWCRVILRHGKCLSDLGWMVRRGQQQRTGCYVCVFWRWNFLEKWTVLLCPTCCLSSETPEE